LLVTSPKLDTLLRHSLTVLLTLGALSVFLTVPATASETPRPSAKARMICAGEAQSDLAGVLATRAKVSAPTWRDRTYSCSYRYPNGYFDIAVTEFPRTADAKKDFAQKQSAPTVTRPSLDIADGAFLRQNGSIVIRKDRRLLTIDPAHLPERFTKLKLSRPAVAQAIATTVLKCWTG
jgi:hypothetical protein